MGGSTSRIYLRFAAISFLTLGIIGVLAGLLGAELVRRSEAEGNAAHAARLAALPVGDIVSADSSAGNGPISAATRSKIDDLTGPLIASGVHAIRVWSADGVLRYGSGDAVASDTPNLPLSPGVSSERRQLAGSSRFVTYLNTGTYTVEVDESSDAMDSATRDTQWGVAMIVGLATLLFFFATQIAFRLGVQKVVAEHRRLRRIYNTGEDLRSSLDLHDVTAQIVRQVTVMARGQYGAVALYERDNGDLLLRATYEHADTTITHHQRSIDEWFLRRCVATNTTIVNSQAASAYRGFFSGDFPLTGQWNVLCVPMSIRDEVVGVISVLRAPTGRGDGFAAIEVRQAIDIASQGAMAVEQAALFSKVRAYAAEVELSYDSTLKALMAALDAKDDVTEGHCERVARLTVHLAKHLDVDERSLLDIERGALLHDVGKIGVPDAVLQKPAALNDDEWEAMRKHPLLAGVMISDIGFLEGATPILLYHHERFDGAGYPFHLQSDKIPFEARIFSVADAYDAMTSDRPYRKAMSHEAAMAEIAANSGTQFDPAIAASFEHLMYVRPELRKRLATPRVNGHSEVPQVLDTNSAA
jgi:HD-GYP domain-containing protein (c-di-GMP phosphodiesterase class II)